MQITRRQYLAKKYEARSKMLDIKTKVENLDDIVSKIDIFIEDNRTHFYKEGEIDMVEIHADKYTHTAMMIRTCLKSHSSEAIPALDFR